MPTATEKTGSKSKPHDGRHLTPEYRNRMRCDFARELLALVACDMAGDVALGKTAAKVHRAVADLADALRRKHPRPEKNVTPPAK